MALANCIRGAITVDMAHERFTRTTRYPLLWEKRRAQHLKPRVQEILQYFFS